MGGRGGSGRSSAAVPTTLTPEMQLRMAYDAVSKLMNQSAHNQSQGPWVTLVDLRPRLAAIGMGREQQDQEIRRAVRERRAVMGAILYNIHKTQADRDAQIIIGNEPHHFISFF